MADGSAAQPKTQALTMKAAAASGQRLFWFVVRTHVGSERIALRAIENVPGIHKPEGFEVYLPMRLVEMKRRGVVSKEGRPFLPTLLFVRTEPTADCLRPLFSRMGVKSLIMLGGRPAALRDCALDKIREAESDGYVQMVRKDAQPVAQFQAGERVKVNAPRVGFDLMEAVFAEQVDGLRAAVLVSGLGRDSRVLVPIAELTAAPSP